MNPPPLFCPNNDCPSRGFRNQDNIRVHDGLQQRYRCRTCKQTFRSTQGTIYHGKKYPPETIARVIALLSWGCPLQAIVVAFEIDERTVQSWREQGGEHCERFHEECVLAKQSDLVQVQADEMYVKLQKKLVLWMAMAMCIPTRLWLGGVLAQSRDQTMLQKLARKIKSCAAFAPILLITDGFRGYVKTWQNAFREPKQTGKRGRPPLVAWPHVVIAQMVKQYKKGRVVGIDQRLIQGTLPQLMALLPEECKISTAYIERLNATFRARCHGLVRRGRGLAKQTDTLKHGMYLVGCCYNFCTPHQSLRCAEGIRTPAMAAGLTHHCWSVGELLAYRFAPPPFVVKKRRGRKPKSEARLQEEGNGDFTG
jgi:transposase-like protein